MNHWFIITLLCILLYKAQASFLDSPSLATYWGQNSKGGSDTQHSLATYCDGNSDVIILAFVLDFRNKELPQLNLANSCDGPRFPGTNLLQCPEVGKDIKTCQKKGKTILLSLGGAAGAYVFANDKDAVAFADTLWATFGGGKSESRPFGDAVVDGFDLDIEGGGSTGYAAMVKRLRSHFNADKSKKYYITGAPQCPFPDAMLGPALDASEFDAVFVQFYNNYCSTTSENFNFETWDHWARHTSPNRNVKVFLGLPGSSAAAGSGYVPFKTLEPVVKRLYSTYSSFGGVMLWDASASYSNKEVSPHYQAAIFKLLSSLSKGESSKTTKNTKTTSSHTTKTTKSHRPTKTSSLRDCVQKDEPCSGGFGCSGNSFATCVNGRWLLRSCPDGLICLSSTDGVSAYCAQGKAKTCTHKGSFQALAEVDSSVAKAYTGRSVTAQFSFIGAQQHQFTAILNARCLSHQAFGERVKVQFKVSQGIKVTQVKGGTVSQQGDMVHINYHNPIDKAMSIVIQMQGLMPTDGMYIGPSMNSIKFY
ncbi:hypothetical protein G6F62_008986 [Rhizopus arrhizus]|nr:hypothetical protein G6F62_008986 [Rhizopus arrhizus]